MTLDIAKKLIEKIEEKFGSSNNISSILDKGMQNNETQKQELSKQGAKQSVNVVKNVTIVFEI